MCNITKHTAIVMVLLFLLLSSVVSSLYYRETLAQAQTENREKRKSTAALARKISSLAMDWHRYCFYILPICNILTVIFRWAIKKRRLRLVLGTRKFSTELVDIKYLPLTTVFWLFMST